MIRPKHTLLAIIWLLLLGTGAYAQQSSANSTPPGTLAIYYGNGDAPCTIPAQTSAVYFVKQVVSGTNCKNPENGDYLKLNNFPSATKLFLVNGRPRTGGEDFNTTYCGLHEDVSFGWWELKTIKESMSTDNIAFGDIKTIPLGEVIAPGLVMVDRVRKGNPASPDDITCLIIEVSP